MNNAAEEFEDYGPEPNMKLSHAFLVVLALHVVAVGGLYAFNTIKAGNRGMTKTEAKSAPLVAKGGPSGEKGSTNESSGGSGDQDKNRPPSETKPAPVAKLSKPADSSNQNSRHSEGILGMIKKFGIGGATAAGAATVSAQEPPTATNASPTESAGVPQTYMVKSGDTITRIASSLGVSIPDLEKVNGLAGNAVLQVGQILKVPAQVITQAATSVQTEASQVAASVAKNQAQAVASGNQASAAVAAPAVGETASSLQYTVVKGDNPYKIAKKFKITPDELMKANGISDPKKIQIGQILKIPTSATKVKPSK